MQWLGPMQLNFEGLQMQKWNILTDRAQKASEKKGIICPAITFPPKVMVIKMAHLFVFSAYGSKMLITVWAKCFNASGISYWILSENGMFNRLCSYHLWDIENLYIKKPPESAKNTEIPYFQELTSC